MTARRDWRYTNKIIIIIIIIISDRIESFHNFTAQISVVYNNSAYCPVWRSILNTRLNDTSNG